MTYWDGDRWLKGPELYHWLESLPEGESDELRWKRHRWKRGRTVDLYALEIHLCQLGIHPSEIPAECWSKTGPDWGGWNKKSNLRSTSNRSKLPARKQKNAPAALTRPGAGHEGVSSVSAQDSNRQGSGLATKGDE